MVANAICFTSNILQFDVCGFQSFYQELQIGMVGSVSLQLVNQCLQLVHDG